MATFDEDEEFSTPSKGKGKEKDPKKSSVPVAENEADLDCGWGDTELMKAKNPLPRIYPQKEGEAVRFALFPGVAPKRALTHYVDKKGNFRCLAHDDTPGICCDRLKANPQLTIVALAVQYTNCSPKTGKYTDKYKVPETEWQLGYVKLSRSNYTQICKLVEDGEEGEAATTETVFDFDMIMTHNDTTGIGYTITRASRSPRWAKDAEMAAEIKEAAEKFADGKLLTQRLGRKLSKVEWQVLLSDPDGEASGDDDL